MDIKAAIQTLNSAVELLSGFTGPRLGPTLTAAGAQSLYVEAPLKMRQFKAEPWSLYYSPIDHSEGRLSGYGRMAGQASNEVQESVIQSILDASSALSAQDQAILLGIARIESGYNPDASAPSTSAAGVFQFVKRTGAAFGLSSPSDFFDAEKNIEAGIKLYIENSAILDARYPGLKGDERAAMLYALHHDGPSLAYGGYDIAVKRLIPILESCKGVVANYRSHTDYGAEYIPSITD